MTPGSIRGRPALTGRPAARRRRRRERSARPTAGARRKARASPTHRRTVTVLGLLPPLLLLAALALALITPTARAASAGLVAAYSFDEAKGSTVVDSSPSRNNGRAYATPRVRGRHGRALSFNGRSSRVTVPGRASLRPTGALTVEAWVKVAGAPRGRRGIVTKEGLGGAVWGLYARGASGRPAAEVRRASGRSRSAAPAPLRPGRWTHLAMTYDGGAVRLYRDGVLVSTTRSTGALRTSTSALRIGGNPVRGDWFRGVIDDVRIYNRALTAAEIRADRRGAVAPGPATSPRPGPSAATPAAGGGFQFGVVATRGDDHVDAVKSLHGTITRIEYNIDQPVGDLRQHVGRAAAQGIEVILLANWDGMPSADQARNLGNWAREYGPGGNFWKSNPGGANPVRYIEFGNEHSYDYRGVDDRGGEYAQRARDAYQAIHAANPRVGLLVQADDANTDSPAWVNAMFAAVPNLGSMVAGWTLHPYGREAPARVQRLINQTQARGAPATIPVFITEWGLATDDGRSLSNNYGWPTGMTYQQAADALNTTVNDLVSRYANRIAVFLWYREMDHAAPGASSEREDYFGGLRSDGSGKGPLTAAIRALGDRYPRKG
ncbi:MAG: LamG domain-containing protein [Thermoleophilia bacterium]